MQRKTPTVPPEEMSRGSMLFVPLQKMRGKNDPVGLPFRAILTSLDTPNANDRQH